MRYRPIAPDDLARLRLIADDDPPVVTIVSKYNHDKSLLNELTGQQAFAVSSKRETVTLAHSIHEGGAASTRQASTPMTANSKERAALATQYDGVEWRVVSATRHGKDRKAARR
ncbi:hypothetical protein F4827_003265 [Paraburkholderia bannensis]|jgi:hypothetical protein|uniref:Uncharacterized protein n=1 Tax=Paraburkholderia bannensis TaxID=765414 RepID=A0A7W9WRP3_9BURK|nr:MULTISPECIES: hypothetical protein [Paraburkholderia]MBB3258397.1 hypothetical protein [Paraburkholderia sp. WP4_3_2]MBB6103410.1 hypothetical protein [Paraburkholderia bannensis]